MDTELLISAVFKRRPIWDQKDKNHRNRYILDKLWSKIVAEDFKEFNCTGTFLILFFLL